MTSAFIEGQSRIVVSGPEAADFLQGLVTTDIEALQTGTAAPGALLTPQGKVLFFFMISRGEDGFSIEVDGQHADAFVKRLTMYKLRAKVTIGAPEPGGTTVYWDEPPAEGAVRDIRFDKAGVALYRSSLATDGDRGSYDTLRIKAAVAEPGFDFALSDAFPHDILMDKSGGVSFRKGCFVGQEVVSRMQHRGTARRRLVQVSAASALPASGTDIVAGGKVLGTIGTVVNDAGLAIVRIDRAGAAIDSGTAIMADGVAVSLSLPDWSGLSFPASESED